MGLFSSVTLPPICPKCRKRMKKRSSLSITAHFTEAMQPERYQDYICKAYVPNPDYVQWLKDKKKGFGIASKNQPPEMIPCENHYNMMYDKGSQRIRARIRKQYFQKNFFGKAVKANTGFRTRKNE